MATHESNIRCWCGRYALEWVSFTEKNPGRRFMRCSNRIVGCGFWEWLDEPVSPPVRSIRRDKLKQAERKVKILYALLLLCIFIVMMLVFGSGNVDDCTCKCNYGVLD
ncbi:hypothetical protein LIER_14178 [Lithospermum erythrorhizon]|uniref:GRF-type domain-containing protein n=1 Tax=Lithospermum erythrorhizon TaxID=34254 RepID=A0AAV3Q0P1_LITER